MSQATLILVTGYARSGKDTLSEGILSGITTNTRWAYKRSFADTLKEAANGYLEAVGLQDEENDFYSEAFKVRHRSVLVELGRFARSINQDIFVELFAQRCVNSCLTHGNGLVVCPDWRYLNELRFVQKWMGDTYGWRIITVEVNTAGIGPANEEEGKSIGEIRRNVALDATFTFSPDNSALIKAEGRNLARTLGL